MTAQDGVKAPGEAMAGRRQLTIFRQRLDALAVCFAYRAAIAILVAVPLSVAAATVVGDHPRGDAVLWDRGGVWLVEALSVAGPTLRAWAPYGSLVMLAAAFGWLLPLGALIASASPGTETMPWRGLLSRSALCYPTLALMFGATLLLQTITLGLFTVSASLLAGLATSRTEVADGLRVAGPAVGVLLAWLIAVGQDVVRASLVQRKQSLYQALGTGWDLLRGFARSVLLAAAWRTALTLFAFLLAAVVGAKLTGGAADQLPLVVVLHGLAGVIFVWSRGSWFHWLSPRLAALSVGEGLDGGAEALPSPSE
ncbi:MAG: hypothetical protein DRI90_12900 [Deltaproteobacteria bacterium]|nr:MAG: hypothetical protein DRI90_12900 [Deltaproteobacteria bacterium]